MSFTLYRVSGTWRRRLEGEEIKIASKSGPGVPVSMSFDMISFVSLMSFLHMYSSRSLSWFFGGKVLV